MTPNRSSNHHNWPYHSDEANLSDYPLIDIKLNSKQFYKLKCKNYNIYLIQSTHFEYWQNVFDCGCRTQVTAIATDPASFIASSLPNDHRPCSSVAVIRTSAWLFISLGWRRRSSLSVLIRARRTIFFNVQFLFANPLIPIEVRELYIITPVSASSDRLSYLIRAHL
jgi:hypothetical protein